MSTIESTLPPGETLRPPSRWQTIQRTLRSWLTTWEIYPILLASGFLHFYQPGITEFDQDQSALFGLARNAVLHGLLPATSNTASIQIVNPPFAIYLLMIPAAISANPLGGAILVASLNVLSALLTYVFVRRYFGRVAGTIAAFLFGTAAVPLGYSRFIWQPNMMAPFIVLFFFALFWGVVEHRKGWLFPALLLLGILTQMHEMMALLAAPLLLAVVFAPQTIRWRDLALGLLSLLVIFSTYLAYLVVTHFHDITVLLSTSKQPAYFDPLAFTYYRDFFSPYNTLSVPSDPHTLIYHLLPVLVWLRRFMLLLVVAGFVVALIKILLGFRLFAGMHTGSEKTKTGETNEVAAQNGSPRSLIARWWSAVLPSPLACGLILLLVWQAVFLLVLSRHSRSVPLVFHYLLAVMPGPFIMVGIFVGSLAGWLHTQRQWWRHVRFVLYLFMSLILIAQFAGSTAWLLDQVNQQNQVVANHHSLSSLQRAMGTADLLARQQHLSHVYVTSDMYTQTALQYLAAQMQTPTTVFDESRCLILPNSADGPAVLLVGPGDALTPALLARYGSMIEQPSQNVAPFHLYIVQSVLSSSTFGTGQTFTHELQALDGRLQHINIAQGAFLTAAWSLLKNEPAAYGTSYVYSFSVVLGEASRQGQLAKTIQSQCSLSSLRAGDELVVAFPINVNAAVPPSVNIAAQFHIQQPVTLAMGPFHLETFTTQWVQHAALRTASGRLSVTLKS
jgi:hypothetical protein